MSLCSKFAFGNLQLLCSYSLLLTMCTLIIVRHPEICSSVSYQHHDHHIAVSSLALCSIHFIQLEVEKLLQDMEVP